MGGGAGGGGGGGGGGSCDRCCVLQLGTRKQVLRDAPIGLVDNGSSLGMVRFSLL